MGNVESPYLLAKRLEGALVGILSGIDAYELDAKLAKLVGTLQRQIVDARLDVRDYELSETRAEQLAYAKSGKKRLEGLRKNILTASEYNIFGAVDVAQLSAYIEQIMGQLE